MTFTFKQGDRPLEGYTIQRGVGRGGFGEVYYALSDSGKEVALKYLRDNPQVEVRGVTHCLNLKSPHLVTIYDLKQNAQGEWFVIMEYVSGPSLRDLMLEIPAQQETLRAGPFDPQAPSRLRCGLGVQKAAFFLREVAKGLAYLHDRGIVHRDLKPGNIFYDEGYVKIGDYGLSKAISASQHSGQTMSVGTVHYMAPEVGSGNYSKTIDIYALGVMLYEMLLGRVPYEGATMGEVLMKHLTAQPEVDELPEPFPQVIRKSLAKDPNDRYQTVNEMVNEVFAKHDLNESVNSFEPASISTVAAHVAERLRYTPAGVRSPLGTGSSNVGGLGPPPLSPTMAPTPAPEKTPALGRVLRRVAPTAAITLALSALAVAVGDGIGAEAIPGVLGCVAGMVGGVLIGTWISFYQIRNVSFWTHRLINVGCVLVLMMPGMLWLVGEFGRYHRNPISWALPLLIPVMFGDWTGRVFRGRRGEVNVPAALWAGLFALIAGAVLQAEEHSIVLGIVAVAASLALELVSALWPLRPGEPTPDTSSSDQFGTIQTIGPATGSATPAPVAQPAVHDRAGAWQAMPPAGRVPPPVLRVDLQARTGGSGSVSLRSHGVRTGWLVASAVLLCTSAMFFVALGVIPRSKLGTDESAAVCATGVACAIYALFAMTRGLGRYQRGLWRGVWRPLIVATGFALAGASAVVPGFVRLDGEELLLVIGSIMGGVLISALVWIIPVAPFAPVTQAEPESKRFTRRGRNLMIAGGALVLAIVPYAVIIDETLHGSEGEIALAVVIPPLGLGAIACFVFGGIALSKAGGPREKLQLPIQRSFHVPRVAELDDLVQRHFVLLGYRLVTKARLLWSFERGTWAAQLWHSDIRNLKTTINIAAYESPEGYRIAGYVNVQTGWTSVSQKDLSSLAGELDDLEALLTGDTASAYQSAPA